MSYVDVLFDGYNANPDSVATLFSNLKEIKKKGKWLALIGEMLEMGDLREDVHREAGERCGELPFDQVLFAGESFSAFEAGFRSLNKTAELTHHKTSTDDSIQQALTALKAGDLLVVKGSRGMALEKAIKFLRPTNLGQKE